eukprot:maker-scaffold68_size422247-snap-gene-3.19 protein:Tk11399 transcript:maker-scaffold68_size422247-snap-gene-3.19-mRNA-1 annotation:"hypothetical protein DAPPUDRAFT_300160"
MDKEPFIDGHAVQLTPSWEERNVPEDQLNFRNFSQSMDRLDLEMNPPRDRWNLIYYTFVLHGVGTLMPWNMFITAKEYFVDYKLGTDYTGADLLYATYFLQYIAFAAQVPNVIFNWINIFLNVTGSLTGRIVWTLLIEVIIFVITIILAMINTSTWPGIFFYITLFCVIILNMVNGIYQNTVYGLAAKLPFQYTGAVVLGSNLSGTIVALVNIISIAMAPNPRTAAIYYFITALFILLACFDTYFALPLNRFFRYHDHMYNQALQEKRSRSAIHAIPYWNLFKKCFPQCFNVFFTFFVTLTIFPAMYADIAQVDENFILPKRYFSALTCFLTFNLSAVIGNLLPSVLKWPSPRWLFVPVLLRFFFIPFFALCNYRPVGVERLWPVLIHWDWGYWIGGSLMGLSSGYFSSMAMMYCPRSVEPEYASTAGMFGAASIVTGIFSGIGFSYVMPMLVSHPDFDFEEPSWWPHFVLESIVKSDLEQHLLKVNALPNSQFGFWKTQSSTAAIATAQAQWLKGSQGGNVVGVLAFDLSSAFDTVDKAQLIPKLAALGIKGTALSWFDSYLSGGRQCVDWSGTRSSFADVTFGVRQGSILGPCLFLVIMADLPDCLRIGEECNVGYADDVSIWAVGKDLPTVKSLLDQQAESFARFAAGNGLIMNASKTQLMLGGKVRRADFHVVVDGVTVFPD